MTKVPALPAAHDLTVVVAVADRPTLAELARRASSAVELERLTLRYGYALPTRTPGRPQYHQGELPSTLATRSMLRRIHRRVLAPEQQPVAIYYTARGRVGSSRVDLQACKLEYSIVSPK